MNKRCDGVNVGERHQLRCTNAFFGEVCLANAVREIHVGAEAVGVVVKDCLCIGVAGVLG